MFDIKPPNIETAYDFHVKLFLFKHIYLLPQSLITTTELTE